ncbi:MAG TPA: M23 family metallopeptidase [Chitinophagaceae bacterium]|nr:M23 family metallopeptidase [Chitinophagaceae bacterium]
MKLLVYIIGMFSSCLLLSLQGLCQESHNDNLPAAEQSRIFAKAAQYYHRLGELKKRYPPTDANRTAAGHVLFSWPLKVNSNYDDIPNYYSIVNYWDLTSGSAETDWQCGSRTYNGHNGTDIALWPFWWRMKDNDNVFAAAAAPGVVIDVVQGFGDENCELSSFPTNIVSLLHSDSSISHYLHLKANSALVNENDIVSEGQPLAVIGSSGRSTYPHLHFQVEDKNNNSIEPFKNPVSPDCNTLNSDTWWKNQKPYWEPQVNRIATHSGRPSLWGPDDTDADYFCRNNENARLKNNFSAGDSLYAYIYFHDMQSNDDYDLEIIAPNGSVRYSNSRTNSGAAFSFGYYFEPFKIPANAETGTWQLRVTYRAKLYKHYFTVSCVANYNLSTESGSYGRIASDYIQSTTIVAGSNDVRLQAGNYIDLKPGFHAQAGTTFKARIRECNYTD